MSENGMSGFLGNATALDQEAYLNTAAEGLPLAACVRAVSQYFEDKSLGEPGRVRFWAEYERARAAAARLFSVSVKQTALVSSTTEALNTIAHAIDWRPDDEVVFTAVEFPSNIAPWVALQRRGVKVRIVPPRKGLVSVDEILDQVNTRTRLVTVSQVSYATGQLIDPRPLWEAVSRTNTLLCIDATQAAGRVPLFGDCADFTIASAFKWLNSIHGAAVFTVSERVLSGELVGPAGWLSAADCYAPDRFEQFRPRSDAQRFQAGMPNFDSIYALAAALDFHTPEQVLQRKHALEPIVTQLWERLKEFGLNVLAPSEPKDRAGIVPFAWVESATLKQQLAEAGVHVHGDDGRVRAAIHWYNTAEHIDQYLTALQNICRFRRFRMQPSAQVNSASTEGAR